MNIAEILKYCPKGTKLYSLVDGEVTLEAVEIFDRYPIKVSLNNSNVNHYTKTGLLFVNYDGECVLFPSKKQRDWNKFRIPIKKGDIMMEVNGKCPFIATGEWYNDISPKYICGINSRHIFQTDFNFNEGGWTSDFYIPASEEAKKDLFDKMAEAGYKWNADTLELEKIELKSKEGNVLIKNNTLFLSTGVIINDVLQTYCLCADGTFVSCGLSPISSLELAPEELKCALFSVMTKEGYKYDKEQHKLVKQELKPFNRVLVKNKANEKWSVNIFSHYYEEDDEYPYVCLSGRYSYCIPYEGNEYLLVLENKQHTI